MHRIQLAAIFGELQSASVRLVAVNHLAESVMY